MLIAWSCGWLWLQLVLARSQPPNSPAPLIPGSPPVVVHVAALGDDLSLRKVRIDGRLRRSHCAGNKSQQWELRREKFTWDPPSVNIENHGLLWLIVEDHADDH